MAKKQTLLTNVTCSTTNESIREQWLVITDPKNIWVPNQSYNKVKWMARNGRDWLKVTCSPTDYTVATTGTG